MKVNAITQLSLKKDNQTKGLGENVTSSFYSLNNNSEDVMNFLNAQGVNNIAFQAKMNSAVLKKAGKKLIAPLSVAGLLALMVPSTTSCTKGFEELMDAYLSGDTTYVNVSVNVVNNAEIDVSSLLSILDKMYEQDKLSDEEQAAFNEKVLAALEDLKSGQSDQNQYLQTIIDLKKQAITQAADGNKEILARLEDIEELHEQGLLNDEMYNKELTKLLESISGDVSEIKDILKNFHKDFVAARDSVYSNLGTIIENGKLNYEALMILAEGQKHIQKDLVVLNNAADSLISIASDDTRHKELIETINNKNLSDEDFAKFEAMFKAYGLDLADVINMSKEDLKAVMIEWKDNDLKLQEKQIVLLGDILKEAQALNDRPGLDLSNLEKAIKELQDTYQTGNKDLLGSLNGIQNSINDIHETLKKMYDKLGSMSDQAKDYHELYMEKWTETLDYLMDGNVVLKELKNEQNATNKKLDAFVPKADELIKLMQEFVNKGYGDFPMTEFIAYMDKYGDKNIKNLRDLFIEMGMDKLDENTAPLKDYVAYFEKLVQSSIDNGVKLDKIISLMEASGLTADQLKVIIKEVVDNHKCNCSSGSHEGILDDLENKLNGLV